MKKRVQIFDIVNTSLVVLLVVLFMYPLWFVLIASISDPKLISKGEILFLPQGINFSGYRLVFEHNAIWKGYANTIFYTVFGTLLNLLATLPCAYALARRDCIGRNFIMALFVVTMYISGGLIPSYLNIRGFGLVDTPWVLLICGLVSTYNLIVSRTFFQSVSWEMQEASRIDGCSDFNTFIRIVLPLSKPIIVVMALYYGVSHWNDYFNAMVYLRRRELYPLQNILKEILMQSKVVEMMMSEGIMDSSNANTLYELQEQANLLKYCIIVVASLPMLLIYPKLQPYFRKGVMIGAIKG